MSSATQTQPKSNPAIPLWIALGFVISAALMEFSNRLNKAGTSLSQFDFAVAASHPGAMIEFIAMSLAFLAPVAVVIGILALFGRGRSPDLRRSLLILWSLVVIMVNLAHNSASEARLLLQGG